MLSEIFLMDEDRMDRRTRVVLSRLAQGKGKLGDQKRCFIRLFKGTFDSVDLAGSLEDLDEIRRFHKGDSEYDFMVVDGRCQDGTTLAKEGAVFL